MKPTLILHTRSTQGIHYLRKQNQSLDRGKETKKIKWHVVVPKLADQNTTDVSRYWGRGARLLLEPRIPNVQAIQEVRMSNPIRSGLRKSLNGLLDAVAAPFD